MAKIGVELFYLPPGCPVLNDIERVWRAAMYEDCPRRAQSTVDAIGEAVDRAMIRQRDRIRGLGRVDHLYAGLLARG